MTFSRKDKDSTNTLKKISGNPSNFLKTHGWHPSIFNIILRPKDGQVELIGLDWFNQSMADYGYVWPTRIARSKADGRFYGQGIRMGNFILDATGRQKVG